MSYLIEKVLKSEVDIDGNVVERFFLYKSNKVLVMFLYIQGESIIICSAVALVFLLAALLFSCALLGMVSFSQLCRFEVARSVPLLQP
jgi:hypothetical protein